MISDRTTRRLVIGALVIMATVAVPHDGYAQGTIVQTMLPAAGDIVNACNGEVVFFSGTLSLLVHLSESSTGSITTKTQRRIDGSGVSTAGNEYRVFDINDNETTGPKPTANQQFEQTVTENADVNGRLPEDHFILQSKFHFTVTPGDLISALISDIKSCCPGGDGTLSCRPITF